MPAPAPDQQPARPFRYVGHTLSVDGLPLSALAEAHGTPLYVYSAAHLLHRLSLFSSSFASVPHTVCYAVKANSSLAVLRLLAGKGSGFDIVSGGELERVRQAAPAALERVVFSGVGKQSWEIDAALTAGILLFNLESPAEIDLLASRARALGKRARFAFRVNPDVFAETHPYISTGLREHKFGVDIGLARELYRQAAAHPELQAVGVSVHIGSQIRSVTPFAQAIERIAALVHELRADGHTITHVDAGGGLGIDYHAPVPDYPYPTDTPDPTASSITEPAATCAVHEPESQTYGEPAPVFRKSSQAELQVRDYADALRPALAALHSAIPDLHLLLEPGRFLIAEAGALLTRVLHVKRNGTKQFVVTDAAMNDLIRPALYQAFHEILPVTLPAEQGTVSHFDVVGPVCESGDFFARDRPLPPPAAGDLLAILDAGAYGMSQSSNYNTRPRPAEVLIEGGEALLIRRRESLEDLLSTELLP